MLAADGLGSVFQRLAQTQPKAPAVLDRTGVWNYAQLWDSAGRISCFFAERGLKASPSTEFAPRPIAIFLRQGREWYATCIAAWILGIPVVALSSDLPSGQAEAERAKRVASELKPLALVSDDSAFEVPCLPEDCLRLSLEEVRSAISSCNGRKPAACASSESVLCYVYTGGTTRHSKCVAVTHAMALWEIQQYKTALGGLASEGDRMLQYSSAYWGAAIFGQADLALAFGACNVIIRASAPEEIAAICAEHQISVLGIVPSQLRGAWPGGPSTRPRSLRVLIAWAEKIQPKLAKEWLQHLPVIEILIASEYWLCLSSVGCRTWKDPDDGMERHVLDPLPDLDIKLLKENGSEAEAGESGEMFLAGPTVFAGYVGADGRISCPNFRYLDAKRYYGTRDRLKRVPGGRGLVYLGRTDSLAKAGGAWQDLEAVEAAATEVPGVSAAALVACDGSTDAYLVLEDMRDGAGRAREGPPLTAVLDNVMQKLKPAAGNSRPHIWARLPLHPATSKVNRQVLLAQRSEATARETNWHERLHSLQRRMLRGYAAWHVLFGILMLLRASVETPAPTPTLLLDILGRAMLLPYVWGVLLYLWHGTSKQKRNWVNMTMPLGPPDALAAKAEGDSKTALLRSKKQLDGWKRSLRPRSAAYCNCIWQTGSAGPALPWLASRSIHQIRGGYRFNGDDILLAREAWRAAPAARNLLDLGAGTGSVGFFWLAQQPGQSRLTALEAQEESSELLNRSVRLLGLEPRVRVIHGDLRDEGIVQGLQAKYDLVTANPPYILPGDRKLPSHSQRRYCYYELRGGPREFAQTASRSLSEEGKFCIVHVASRSADVDRALADVGLKTVRRLTASSRGEPKWQVLVCSRSPSDLAVDEEELIVRDESGRWTKEWDAICLEMGAFQKPLYDKSEKELSWIRDRDAVAVATALVLSVGMFRIDLLILGMVGLYLQRPSRICFLLSLPSAYVLSFPKWCRDEFIYRSMWRSSYLRRFILRWVPILQKPEFDGSISFQPKSVAYDWGSDERWVNVYLERTQKDDKSTVGFWEPVRPAVLPRLEPEADAHVSNGVAASSGRSSSPGVASASRAESSSLEATLAILVGRVGGRPPSLASLDSLQSIRLVELVRRELGFVATSAMVLRSADVHALAEAIQREGSQAHQCSRQEEGTQPDEEGAYRLYIMEFGKSPVDWCVRYGGPGHLDVDALQRASDRACARHSALRTMELRDEGMREAMDRAAAMWQLVCSAHGTTSWRWSAARRAMRALLFAAWPRTFLKSAHDARVQVRLPDRELVVRDPAFAELSDADYMFWIVTPLRNDHYWPYQICAIPVVRKGTLPPGVPLVQAVRTLPPEDVTWYIYAGITHAYSDGASGNALLTDLLRIYAEEANLDLSPSTEVHSPPEHLALLQHRLRRSLFGRLRGEDNANDDVYHEIVCEDWGRRFGFSKRIKLEPIVVNTLHLAASNVIGCSIDVAWLTAVVGSLLRLFPDQHRFQLILKCACRDGPGQNEMVGFLSEQRVFPIDVGDSRHATLMDVYCAIESVRRSRTWRAPVPFEAGICVYVNIVGSMTEGLPLQCSQVAYPAAGSSSQVQAYAHLNLRIDQISQQQWDFRIFHWDKAWGWGWGSEFAPVLGAVIADMAECPLEALVPAPVLPWRRLQMQPDPASSKRKDPPSPPELSATAEPTPDIEQLARSPSTPPPKVMRVEDG
ncbi:ddaD [Symbiodinium sp. CCMP2592]|nr:ddaD [Symbiodinium sp. CCMP2592]